jgi:hypothetical protein
MMSVVEYRRFGGCWRMLAEGGQWSGVGVIRDRVGGNVPQDAMLEIPDPMSVSDVQMTSRMPKPEVRLG